LAVDAVIRAPAVREKKIGREEGKEGGESWFWTELEAFWRSPKKRGEKKGEGGEKHKSSHQYRRSHRKAEESLGEEERRRRGIRRRGARPAFPSFSSRKTSAGVKGKLGKKKKEEKGGASLCSFFSGGKKTECGGEKTRKKEKKEETPAYPSSVPRRRKEDEVELSGWEAMRGEKKSAKGKKKKGTSGVNPCGAVVPDMRKGRQGGKKRVRKSGKKKEKKEGRGRQWLCFFTKILGELRGRGKGKKGLTTARERSLEGRGGGKKGRRGTLQWSIPRKKEEGREFVPDDVKKGKRKTEKEGRKRGKRESLSTPPPASYEPRDLDLGEKKKNSRGGEEKKKKAGEETSSGKSAARRKKKNGKERKKSTQIISQL